MNRSLSVAWALYFIWCWSVTFIEIFTVCGIFILSIQSGVGEVHVFTNIIGERTFELACLVSAWPGQGVVLIYGALAFLGRL